jgi:hypothetical protein
VTTLALHVAIVGLFPCAGHAFDGSFFLFISLGSRATATIMRTNFTSFSCKQLGIQERQDGIIYTQQLPIRGLPTLYTVVCVSMELPLCCAVVSRSVSPLSFINMLFPQTQTEVVKEYLPFDYLLVSEVLHLSYKFSRL